MKRALVAVMAFVLCTGMGFAHHRTDIQFKQSGGNILTFHVERAVDDSSRENGLMFRKSLASKTGMLFIYEMPGRRIFWMKNTLIPLDMAFITADGTVAYIHPSAVPKDLTPIEPPGERRDICAVLELAGGEAVRTGLKPGDRLVLDDASACLP